MTGLDFFPARALTLTARPSAPSRPQLPEERTHAIDNRALRRCWRSIRRSICDGRLRRRRDSRCDRLTLYSPLKYQRWPHSHSPHDHHQPRVRFRLHLRARIKSQGRHIHGVNRLFLLGRFFIGPRRVARIPSRFALSALHGPGRHFISRQGNVRSLGNLQFTLAMSRTVSQRIDLPVRQRHISALRHHHALPAQLLLQSHRPSIGANAHDSRALESHKKVSRLVTNRHRLPLNLRRIHAQRRFSLQARMDRSTIERHRHCSPRFQYREMRRSANGNLPPFDKANPRLPGLHSQVASAAQNRLRLPANHFHAHRPCHRNVFALDQAYGIAHRLVWRRRGRNKKAGADHHTHHRAEPRPSHRFTKIIRQQHSQRLSRNPAKKLSPILYVTSPHEQAHQKP
jgi:hypothetical protein